MYVPRMLTRSLTSRTLRRLAGLVAVSAATFSFAPPAQAAPLTCPGTFEVLHNDRIGALQLPQGNYTITVLDDDRLSCASATDLFRQFLEDYSGRLPSPWRLNAANATFTRGSGSTKGFRVTRSSTPSGGGGGGHHPGGTSCPGYFRVLHNDHIGELAVPAGGYRITLLAVGRLSCSRASSLLASFLQDFNGILPSPWVLDVQTGTFFRGSLHVGFRIKEAVGPAPSPTPSGRHPSDGSRCPGTFRVLNNDRIGNLRLPAGPYILTTLRGGGLSCSEASSEFREFLSLPMGNLPSPWVLNARKGIFTEGRGSRTGFRVKPAP
jgi:hypothetical protein